MTNIEVLVSRQIKKRNLRIVTRENQNTFHREREREGGREGGRQGGREGGRERERETEREREV